MFLVLFLFLWLLHYPDSSSLILPPLSLFFDLSLNFVLVRFIFHSLIFKGKYAKMSLSSPSTLLDRHSVSFTPQGTWWGRVVQERDGPPSPWDKGALL